jgi:hypothetical protein
MQFGTMKRMKDMSVMIVDGTAEETVERRWRGKSADGLI